MVALVVGVVMVAVVTVSNSSPLLVVVVVGRRRHRRRCLASSRIFFHCFSYLRPMPSKRFSPFSLSFLHFLLFHNISGLERTMLKANMDLKQFLKYFKKFFKSVDPCVVPRRKAGILRKS